MLYHHKEEPNICKEMKNHRHMQTDERGVFVEHFGLIGI